jgi:hypothetical protein
MAAPCMAQSYRGWALPENQSVQCDRALAAAQDIQAMVGTGIVGLVENVPITSYELKQHIAWHVALARDEDIAWKSRTKARILESLRREVLDRVAAQRLGIIVSQADVDAQIDEFLSSHNLTRHEWQMSLERAGVDIRTVRGMVAADMLRARLNRTGLSGLQVSPGNCLRG